jgi:hypothetical protein
MRHRAGTSLIFATAFCIHINSVLAQSRSTRPTFEAVSIKPSPPTGMGGTGVARILPGGRLTTNGALLRLLIFNAYGLRGYYQLLGESDWMKT